MNRIFTRTRKEKTAGLHYFLVFIIISMLLPTCFAENTKKCLSDPAPQKRYMRYGNKALSIILEVSPRITHQLTTYIYYILLKERLGYQAVEIKQFDDDDFNLSIGRLSLEDELDVVDIDAIPTSIVNVEILLPLDQANPSIYLNDVHELGTLSPPGKYGWFIPKELSLPIKDKIKGWTFDSMSVHWTYFKDPYFVQDFDVSVKFSSLIDKYLDKNAFSNGWYIPRLCENKKCAVLFASILNTNTKKLKNHIDTMGVYVKIAWVGPNLVNVVNSIRKRIIDLNVKQSFLIFSWTPSEVVLNADQFVSVIMNPHNILDGKSKDSFYELQRPVKNVWNGLEKSANIAYDMLNHMVLDQAGFDYLLNLYSKMKNTTNYEGIACEWVKANKALWEPWVPEIKNQIIIGGIFPLTGSSYTGIGILRGAQMAVEAINKNKTILTNYELKVLSTDGSCRADRVMSRFIDYVSEAPYKDLVGILGPACSDTVEPLAGISKYHKTIVISYSAEGALLSDRDKYPYFFRTIGENKNYKHVYLQLLKKMKWTRVYALTEDGQKYTEYISHMRNMLEKNGITVSNTKFPRNRERDVMTRYIEELRTNRARIIIADVFDEVARIVMCEAYKQGMTARQGYVWFLPTWLNTTWYDTDYFNKEMNETVNCTTTVMRKAINGYFSIAHAYYADDNDTMQENITVKAWRTNYDRMINEFHLKPSNYAGYAYDAVWTYALSLDQLIRVEPESMADLHSDKTIKNLTDIIKHIDFNGVSGRINFRGGPSRFSIINILQWYNNSTRIVGRFQPNISDGMPPEIVGGNLDLNQSAIVWLGGQIPDDGALSPTECTLNWLAKFLNVQCEIAIIVLNIFIFCILLICFVFGAIYYKKRYDKKVLLISAESMEYSMKNRKDVDKWEIKRDRVVINRKLGEGAFGTVYGGEANLSEIGDAWTPVAVKTLKVGSTTEEQLDFLSEAEVMKRFDHKNIIELLGVCTKMEPIYTVMEFMLYGDLKTFLLARRHLVNGTTVDDGDEVSSKKLTNMALDVARGLSYLTEIKYVHRDVAIRNCLVNGNRVVKLADFGMTRPITENNDYYRFNRKGLLPVRWMSPESLALGHFSPSSDVWSFGVLLYEIITFGSFPFQGYSNSQVLELVKNGGNVDIPKRIHPQLDGLIKSCFNQKATERPKASELVAFLANNGRIISPSLDVPFASITIEDNGELEWQVSDKSRKCSSTRNSFKNLTNGVSSMSIDSPSNRSVRQRQQHMLLDAGNAVSKPVEMYCQKEPLLPTHADSGCEQEESDYCSHVVSNGHAIAISKV